MHKYIALQIIFFITLTACSIKVVPDPVVNGSINQQNNTITITKENIVMTAGCNEPDMVNYNIEGAVASFYIEIQNHGKEELSFDTDGFLLVDSDNRQYYALTPDKLRQMLSKDTYYLLPYPYVGFYYLEDYEQAAFKNSISSNLPYYFELYPQDIYTKALPAGSIIPNAKISGLVYFHADLTSLKSFRLIVYNKGASKSAQPDFVFPFRISK